MSCQQHQWGWSIPCPQCDADQLIRRARISMIIMIVACVTFLVTMVVLH